MALAMALVLPAAGCIDTHILTGDFRSGKAVTMSGVSGFENLHVELVLGHYGPEVAGLIRFFANEDFTIPPQDAAGCDCVIIKKGAYDSGVLNFRFEMPFPCDKTPKTTVSVHLEVSGGGDELTGVFETEEPKSEAEVGFSRKKDSADLTEADKQCEKK